MVRRLGSRQLANRVRWVRALVSGDFEQGNAALVVKHGDKQLSYCCLGVACKVISPKSHQLKIDGYGNESQVLLNATWAREHLGILTMDEQDMAADWNDEKGLNFGRIADLVAYATEHNLAFDDVPINSVPANYHTTWLDKFEENNDTN